MSRVPSTAHEFSGIDATPAHSPVEKARLLREGAVVRRDQAAQLDNPDARILLDAPLADDAKLMAEYVGFGTGSHTGDANRFLREFWELPCIPRGYERWLNTPDGTSPWSGRHQLVLFNVDGHDLGEQSGARLHGDRCFGRRGVMFGRMQELPCGLYDGERFDDNVGVLVPNEPETLPALWTFCSSEQFNTAMRRIDQALKVTAATFVKIPFDLEHWQKVAEERGPLPEPFSDDPTQWLFAGNPARATEPLQVAVARLLGYHWPEHADDDLDALADTDGIVCLPSVAGERPAADRLTALLAAAFGDDWSLEKQAELLASVDAGGKPLALWLRDGFFKQHCKLFHNRPFIWHLWDGRKDGFSALVNYHKLDGALLERLTYTHLGDWISRQRHANDQGEEGADARLVATEALQEELKLIIAGERPYDIFVRWKPLHEQPISWDPDLNDGVRLNIRPFMEAGALRSKPNIKWGKDRGKNPPGAPYYDNYGPNNRGDRVNDRHVKLAEKQKAREEAGVGS